MMLYMFALMTTVNGDGEPTFGEGSAQFQVPANCSSWHAELNEVGPTIWCLGSGAVSLTKTVTVKLVHENGESVEFTPPALNTEVGPLWLGGRLYMVYVN